VSNPEDLSVARYAEQEGTARLPRIKVYAKPIDVAPEMKRLLWDRYPTLVATSATLATGGANDPAAFDYWMERVGFPKGERPVATLVVGSPFDYANNALLYVPQVPAGLDRNEVAATAFIAQQMGSLVEASDGGAFLLFTSYRQMRAVADRLIPALPKHYRIFVQGEQPRDHVIKEFRDAALTITQPAVLFATRSYFEGVDVRGEGLRLVVLDKLPFTNISDPVFQARCRVIDKVSDGTYPTGSFARLALPIMTTVLKQGTGRLIRSQTDRGVVAILDDRLATKGYGKKVLAALPPMARTRALADVQAFYERGRTPRP
jgi:ATP-dependent DNA helicase DinG